MNHNWIWCTNWTRSTLSRSSLHRKMPRLKNKLRPRQLLLHIMRLWESPESNDRAQKSLRTSRNGCRFLAGVGQVKILEKPPAVKPRAVRRNPDRTSLPRTIMILRAETSLKNRLISRMTEKAKTWSDTHRKPCPENGLSRRPTLFWKFWIYQKKKTLSMKLPNSRMRSRLMWPIKLSRIWKMTRARFSRESLWRFLDQNQRKTLWPKRTSRIWSPR